MHPFPEPLHRCSLVTVSALADSVPALHRDSTGLFLKEPTHKLSQEGQCPVSLPSLWNANRGPHTAQESPGHHPAAVRTQGLPCEPQQRQGTVSECGYRHSFWKIFDSLCANGTAAEAAGLISEETYESPLSELSMSGSLKRGDALHYLSGW